MLTPRAQVFGADRKIHPSQLAERKYSVWIAGSIVMLEHSKRLCDVQRSDAHSVAKWSRVEAVSLLMSRCSTRQNASLKEPNENAEYLWRTPIPKEELQNRHRFPWVQSRCDEQQ